MIQSFAQVIWFCGPPIAAEVWVRWRQDRGRSCFLRLNMKKSRLVNGFVPLRVVFFQTACLCLLLTLSAPAQAQTTPRIQVFGGYSYLRFESTAIGFNDNSNLHGGEFSPALNLTKHFGIMADADIHVGNHQTNYNFLIGPQFPFRALGGIVSGHLLFGRTDEKVRVGFGASSKGRAIAAGIAYDRNFSDRLAFRLVQVDYLNTHAFSTGEKNLRISTGIVFHWGERKK